MEEITPAECLLKLGKQIVVCDVGYDYLPVQKASWRAGEFQIKTIEGWRTISKTDRLFALDDQSELSGVIRVAKTIMHKVLQSIYEDPICIVCGAPVQQTGCECFDEPTNLHEPTNFNEPTNTNRRTTR